MVDGHQDDLEITFDKPVVSITLDLPAFLITIYKFDSNRDDDSTDTDLIIE